MQVSAATWPLRGQLCQFKAPGWCFCSNGRSRKSCWLDLVGGFRKRRGLKGGWRDRPHPIILRQKTAEAQRGQGPERGDQQVGKSVGSPPSLLTFRVALGSSLSSKLCYRRWWLSFCFPSPSYRRKLSLSHSPLGF